MGKCKRCKKFFFFKKLDNNMCPKCAQEHAIEMQAEENRRRIEEEIAAHEAEQEKWRKALRELRFPSTIDGLHRVYQYTDVVLTLTPGALENPDFHPGKMLEIVPAVDIPNSPSDAAAMLDGNVVGFLPSNRLSGMVVDWHRDGKPIRAAVRTLDRKTGIVQIYLTFYSLRHYDQLLQSNPNPKNVRLTGNRNKDMQESIWCCEEGMECDIEYDDFKEKYLVLCDRMEIGYLPVSAEKYADDGLFFVGSIETDDNDKYIVYLHMFQ